MARWNDLHMGDRLLVLAYIEEGFWERLVLTVKCFGTIHGVWFGKPKHGRRCAWCWEVSGWWWTVRVLMTDSPPTIPHKPNRLETIYWWLTDEWRTVHTIGDQRRTFRALAADSPPVLFGDEQSPWKLCLGSWVTTTDGPRPLWRTVYRSRI